jgi:hypothetical protein
LTDWKPGRQCYEYALQKAHSSEPNSDWASNSPLSLAYIFINAGKAVSSTSPSFSTHPPSLRHFTWESSVDNMDGLSTAASVIAVVQAAGALAVVAKAFYATFISKDNEDRGGDASDRVTGIEEFIRMIRMLQGAAASSPGQTGSSSSAGNAGTIGNTAISPNLSHILQQCENQLTELRKKANKMKLPPGASRTKRFRAMIRIKFNEADFAPLDTSILALLHELNLITSLENYQHSKDRHVYVFLMPCSLFYVELTFSIATSTPIKPCTG